MVATPNTEKAEVETLQFVLSYEYTIAGLEAAVLAPMIKNPSVKAFG